MDKPISSGDVVRLKSGGPLMTVGQVKTRLEHEMADAYWFCGDQLKGQPIAVSALSRVEASDAHHMSDENEPTILYLDEADDQPITEAEAAKFFECVAFVLEQDSDDPTDNSLSDAEFDMVLAEWRKRSPRRPLDTDDVERIIGRALRRKNGTSHPCEPCESPEKT